MYKTISIVGLIAMAAGLIWLLVSKSLFSWSPIVIAAQTAAGALLAWARVTFGLRSFHAAANPTAGGLITTGPYAYPSSDLHGCVFVRLGRHSSTLVGACGLARSSGDDRTLRLLSQKPNTTLDHSLLAVCAKRSHSKPHIAKLRGYFRTPVQL